MFVLFNQKGQLIILLLKPSPKARDISSSDAPIKTSRV